MVEDIKLNCDMSRYSSIAVLFSILLCVASCEHTRPNFAKESETYSPGDLVYIAFINDSDLLLTTRTVETVLLSKGIHPYIEGSGAGNDVLVRKDDVQAAVLAIARNPELKERSVEIRKEFLYLIQKQ